MVRVGVLNVYWFGLKKDPALIQVGFYRDQPGDDGRVVGLLKAMEVDVLALIEVVDVARLRGLLTDLPGHWRLDDEAGTAVSSKAPQAGDDAQRVVLAWNDDVVELRAWDRPIDAGPRRPVVARFRTRETGLEWTAVAVHPKSGDPFAFDDAAEKRLKHFEAVASFLGDPAPGFAGTTMVLGDFNSIQQSQEVKPLREMDGWAWPEPVFIPPDAARRTTLTDPAIIDHFVLSPGITFSTPEVIAFDVLADFPEAAPASGFVWKRTTDHRALRIRIDA